MAELPRLFEALDGLQLDRADVVYVCLLLDGCVDGSAVVADAYRARSPHRVRVEEAPPSAPNAGRARHRAMMLGMAALRGDRGLLLTTDADSLPSPTWLRAMTAALKRADVVAGRIVRHGVHPNHLQDRVETYYDALFALRRRLDPVPWEAASTHHHTGGANMGIRADAYRAIGGFVPVLNGEDALLVDDAGRAGLRVTRDAASLVHTSDRRAGRAVGGLAQALLGLDQHEAATLTVAHPADAAWQYRMHATARAAYADDRLETLALSLALTYDHVLGVARDCPNAEAFAMRIVPVPPDGMRDVALPVAEVQLGALRAVAKTGAAIKVARLAGAGGAHTHHADGGYRPRNSARTGFFTAEPSHG